MSVCRKHKQQGRRACNCRVSSRALYDGYGGPDYTDIAVAVSDSFSSWSSSGSDSSSSSSSYDSGSSSSSSSYDSGSSSSDSGSW